jgi:hypothetical protein
MADGGDIRQWTYFGGDNQQWKLTELGNGRVSIVSKFSGKAIEVYDFSTANGGDVRQWTYWGGDSQ